MTIDLSSLQGLDPNGPEWEAARKRLILDYIDTCPEERQIALLEFQGLLDQARAKMTSLEFLMFLQEQMLENLLNLDDQLTYLKNTISDSTESSPEP